MKIIKAIESDHLILSEITKKSKNHWAYGDKLIREWNDDLTVSPEYINQTAVYKLIMDECVVGYYAFCEIDEKTVLLDNLFLLPEFIGKGIGKFLLFDFYDKIKNKNYSKIRLVSDPHAEDFYAKFDFKVVGKKESSIKNRFLPIMERLL